MGRASPVVKAKRLTLVPGTSVDAAARHMLASCLAQVTGNLAALAKGAGTPEHVHQARVGIRRARTVLREFGEHSVDVDPDWSAGLAEVFRSLGTSRDLEVVVSRWAGAIAAAGAPQIAVELGESDDPSVVARAALDGALLRQMLDHVQGPPVEGGDTIEAAASKCLDRLHRTITRDARHFASATVPERHSTRKRVKRLRYTAEMTASLFRPRRVRRFLDALEPAQNALGEFNDLSVAESYFRARVVEQPAAWFAVGWLAAQEPAIVETCGRTLRVAAEAEPYWDRA